MSFNRFYKAFILLAVFLVTAVGAASICSKDPSSTACNPNSLESKSDNEYIYYRSNNGTSSPDNGHGNGTDDGKVYPFFGNVGLVLNTPNLNKSKNPQEEDLIFDFTVEFNGTVGNTEGDKIFAKLSSPLADDSLKFTLELLALDKSGNVFKIPNGGDLSYRKTNYATPTTKKKSSKKSMDKDLGMFCIKMP